MNQTPIFILKGGVEVVKIDRSLKRIDLVVHIKCTPEELLLPKTKEFTYKVADNACRYLSHEGFLGPKGLVWSTHVKHKIYA